eukprot:4190589-Pyramimonas_sp.AAC.1
MLREAHRASRLAVQMVAQFCTRVAARIGVATPLGAQAQALGRAIGTIEGGFGPPRPHSRYDPAVTFCGRRYRCTVCLRSAKGRLTLRKL